MQQKNTTNRANVVNIAQRRQTPEDPLRHWVTAKYRLTKLPAGMMECGFMDGDMVEVERCPQPRPDDWLYILPRQGACAVVLAEEYLPEDGEVVGRIVRVERQIPVNRSRLECALA